MTCRDCRWLNVPLDSAGRRRPNRIKTYNCMVEVPRPPLPASIVTFYNFRWPPERYRVSPEDGAGCPLHEPIARPR